MHEMETKYEHGDDGKGWAHGDHKTMMWHVVRMARVELLKEKVKKKLEAVEGKKLDEMADLLVEARMELRKAKREFWAKKMDLKEKMMEVFSDGESEEAEG
jgi:ABC-type Zn2+ transport system substrate-binding protein/surface adhesin